MRILEITCAGAATLLFVGVVVLCIGSFIQLLRRN